MSNAPTTDSWAKTHALIVVDVQEGFDDPVWGRRNNPACERNIGLLLRGWRDSGWPIIYVRHNSQHPDSPLSPRHPGNAFKPVIDGTPDLLVTKETNSCFYGAPDLHSWLQRRNLDAVAICGITTNHCCETTARMAGNLGYETKFILDATCTFDRADLNGELISADDLARATAANLNGEFAVVLTTADALAALAAASAEPAVTAASAHASRRD